MLADVDCDGNLVCYATGKQGITLLTTTGGTSWTPGRRRHDATR